MALIQPIFRETSATQSVPIMKIGEDLDEFERARRGDPESTALSTSPVQRSNTNRPGRCCGHRRRRPPLLAAWHHSRGERYRMKNVGDAHGCETGSR
jgi:hypothetical protein